MVFHDSVEYQMDFSCSDETLFWFFLAVKRSLSWGCRRIALDVLSCVQRLTLFLASCTESVHADVFCVLQEIRSASRVQRPSQQHSSQ